MLLHVEPEYWFTNFSLFILSQNLKQWNTFTEDTKDTDVDCPSYQKVRQIKNAILKLLLESKTFIKPCNQ